MRGLKFEFEFAAGLESGRIPYGMRGFKSAGWRQVRCRGRRIPYGMRGLKSRSGVR